PRLEFIHSYRKLFLFFSQVNIGIVQEKLVIFVHGKGAPVDQENDEHSGQTGPKDQQCRHHKTPPLFWNRSRLLEAVWRTHAARGMWNLKQIICPPFAGNTGFFRGAQGNHPATWRLPAPSNGMLKAIE